MHSHSSYEDNLGFLKDYFNWYRSITSGLPIGNYRLIDVTILSSFGPYKCGDKIAKMDVSLISGKIDIHRENKDILTLDILPQFAYCNRCDNTGKASTAFYRIDNCPDCNTRKGV